MCECVKRCYCRRTFIWSPCFSPFRGEGPCGCPLPCYKHLLDSGPLSEEVNSASPLQVPPTASTVVEEQTKVAPPRFRFYLPLPPASPRVGERTYPTQALSPRTLPTTYKKKGSREGGQRRYHTSAFSQKGDQVFHYAHNTGASPYPFLASIHAGSLALSFVRWTSGGGVLMLLLVFISLLFLGIVWGKDIYMEGLAGAHNAHVRYGLFLSFSLFIFREAMLFVSIFWAYFDAALVPSIWLGKVWPPVGVVVPSFLGLPLAGTLLLLCRGLSLTWCHASLLANRSGRAGFIWTILLALSFLGIQLVEYSSLSFTIRDSVYGSLFYFSTGFHGLHVLVGVFLLLYRWYWVEAGAITPLVHVGFRCAVLYWHFVDVVWLFLYIVVYVWGS
jgi:heme/copper-type cytochrome/quinol oxidase subunit 3